MCSLLNICDNYAIYFRIVVYLDLILQNLSTGWYRLFRGFSPYFESRSIESIRAITGDEDPETKYNDAIAGNADLQRIYELKSHAEIPQLTRNILTQLPNVLEGNLGYANSK